MSAESIKSKFKKKKIRFKAKMLSFSLIQAQVGCKDINPDSANT